MQQNLNNVEILYIVLGLKFGFLEKRAIADAVAVKKSGAKPVVLCRKDSYAYEQCQINGLDTIVYKKAINSRFDLGYLLYLKKLLKQNKFQFIHCFGLRYIWAPAYLLKRNEKVGLFLTLNNIYKKKLKSALYKYLYQRVDMTFCFSKRMKEMILHWIPANSKKIKVMGTGVFQNTDSKASREEQEVKKIGVLIRCDLVDTQRVLTFINSMVPLLEGQYSSDLKVVFFAQRSWSQMKVKSRLVELLHEKALDYKVELRELRDKKTMFEDISIFVSLCNDAVDDFVIYSALHNVPMLIARNGVSEDIGIEENHPFETYKSDDPRELRAKCLKILDNYPDYLKASYFHQSKFEKVHSSETYQHDYKFYFSKIMSKLDRKSL